MFSGLADAIPGNEVIAWQSRVADIDVRFDAGLAGCWTMAIHDGQAIMTEGPMADERHSHPTIVLCATAEDWRRLLVAQPDPGFVSLQAMLLTGTLSLDGDFVAFLRHQFMIEAMLATLRPKCAEPPSAPVGDAHFDPIIGRYLRLDIDGRPYRVYIEEAGDGVPLVCLHTAGADGRQYRHLLNDPEITARFRVIAIDMPWHGKSAPPPGFQNELYRLTTDHYVSQVLAVKRALGLDRPVVMGCSIGGRVVLHLALRHGYEFRAAIGLQSALYAEMPGIDTFEDLTSMYRPDVDGGLSAAAAVASVMPLQSPSQDRWETLWYYMQGGPGVFLGDINYYLFDGDLRNGAARGIDTARCPLHLLTGDYDLSATPALSAELAAAVGAASFSIMPGLGHFPMSENHPLFRSHLMPVLERILAAEPERSSACAHGG